MLSYDSVLPQDIQASCMILSLFSDFSHTMKTQIQLDASFCQNKSKPFENFNRVFLSFKLFNMGQLFVDRLEESGVLEKLEKQRLLQEMQEQERPKKLEKSATLEVLEGKWMNLVDPIKQQQLQELEKIEELWKMPNLQELIESECFLRCK